jgi:hypothetical protein
LALRKLEKYDEAIEIFQRDIAKKIKIASPEKQVA